MSNAEKNVQRMPKQRRHNELLKKFATSLLIFAGPLSYEFVHRNMPEALPSLQRILLNDYQPFHEGKFRFDELEKHLISYKAPMVVTIGEDATRLVKRVDYDSETDRLVGFVLPCDARGLPLHDSFIAVSFEAMTEAFQNGKVANNAFVFMAQSLCDGVPAFCLACVGTDNKFSADLVLNRWTHIVSECKKRGITVASFGADGDSRELKAMQVSTSLLSTQSSSASLSPSNGLKRSTFHRSGCLGLLQGSPLP